MGQITTHKEGRFPQVDLEDGGKILLSRGATDTRVFQLNWLKLPKKTLHIFSQLFIAKLIRKLGVTSDYIKYLAEELAKCHSVEEVKQRCKILEADL